MVFSREPACRQNNRRFLDLLDGMKIKAVPTINGSAIAAYEPIAQATLDRGWDFIGPAQFDFAQGVPILIHV